MRTQILPSDLDIMDRHDRGEPLSVDELHHLAFLGSYILGELLRAEKTIAELSSRMVAQLETEGRAAELLAPLALERAP